MCILYVMSVMQCECHYVHSVYRALQYRAQEAPLSLGFSRQEHWSGLPFPSPMHECESEVAQSCPTLSRPMDYSPPGSLSMGFSQARVLEWGAILKDDAAKVLHSICQNTWKTQQ